MTIVSNSSTNGFGAEGAALVLAAFLEVEAGVKFLVGAGFCFFGFLSFSALLRLDCCFLVCGFATKLC